MCGLEGKHARTGREGTQVRDGPDKWAYRAAAAPGPGVPSAAPRSTPLHMARLAEETVVQRVAALVRGLHRQEDPAVLREQDTCGWTQARALQRGAQAGGTRQHPWRRLTESPERRIQDTGRRRGPLVEKPPKGSWKGLEGP